MPFSNEYRAKIIRYLGYAYTNEDVNHCNDAFDRLDALEDADVRFYGMPAIEYWVDQLDAIFSAIITERNIEGTTKLTQLRYEGRRMVALVANVLQLEVRFDVFSSGAAAT